MSVECPCIDMIVVNKQSVALYHNCKLEWIKNFKGHTRWAILISKNPLRFQCCMSIKSWDRPKDYNTNQLWPGCSFGSHDHNEILEWYMCMQDQKWWRMMAANKMFCLSWHTFSMPMADVCPWDSLMAFSYGMNTRESVWKSRNFDVLFSDNSLQDEQYCKFDIGHESHWPETGNLAWESNSGPIKILYCLVGALNPRPTKLKWSRKSQSMKYHDRVICDRWNNTVA